MKNIKSIITTTVLTTLLTTSTAQAVEYEFSYDGNDKYTFQGRQYEGLNNLYVFIHNSNTIDLEKDYLKMSKANQRGYLDALKIDGSQERNSFIEMIANDGGMSKEKVKPGVDQVFTFISEQEVNGLDFLKYTDLYDFFEKDLEEILEAFSYSQSEGQNNILQEKIEKEFDVVGETIKNKSDFYKSLIEKRNDLLNKPITPGENQRLQEINKQIYATPEYNDFRKSSIIQEALKHNIKRIKVALEAKENSVLTEIVKANLAELSNDLGQFLILNPTASSDLPAVQQSDNAASESLVDSLIFNRDVVASRINGFSAVAAGDLMETYGVWVKGSMSKATQKAKGGSQGYKLDNKSITIGADTGDDSLVGVAYSFSQNNVKSKSASQNKDDITSHTISAYGKYLMTPEVFVSGQGQLGFAQLKKKRATGDLKNNIASAKPKASIMGANAEVGYNYDAIENVRLIPTLGLAHSDVKVKGYQESGNGLNRKVGKVNASRTSATAGVSAQYFADMGDMKIVPEIHANIDYALKTKNSNTVVTILDGIAPISTPSQKAAKARYNLGTSVKAIGSSAYEVSAGYDLGVAKKFQSHTGSLKLRVNL